MVVYLAAAGVASYILRVRVLCMDVLHDPNSKLSTTLLYLYQFTQFVIAISDSLL